jgi:hypothetical protein
MFFMVLPPVVAALRAGAMDINPFAVHEAHCPAEIHIAGAGAGRFGPVLVRA